MIKLEQKNHVGLLYMALFSQCWIPVSLSFTQKHEKDSGLMKQYECYKATWLNNKSLGNLMGKSLARRDAVSFSEFNKSFLTAYSSCYYFLMV